MANLFRRDTPEPSWDDGAIEAKINAARAAAAEEPEDDAEAMPTPLRQTVAKQIVIAVAVVLVCSLLALVTKHLSYLVGFIISAYLAYNVVNLVYDYKKGLIHRRVLLCSSVNRNFAGRQIIMQDVSEEPVKVYEFYFPKKGNCPFMESCVYLVYTHDNDPRKIVAWSQT